MFNKLSFSVMLFFIAGLFTTINAQSVDDIISKHVAAIGGKDMWNKITTLHTEMSADQGGLKIPINVWSTHLKGTRVEFVVQGMKGIQVMTDVDGWSVMPFMGQTKPQPTNTEEIKAGKSQLDIRGQLLDYAAKGHKVELLGEDEEEGVEVYKLKVTDANGTEVTYFIDKSNFMIIKQSSKIKFQGQEIENSTNFSNYKSVDGVMMPYSMTSGQMGRVDVTKYEINPKIEADFYTMPKE